MKTIQLAVILTVLTAYAVNAQNIDTLYVQTSAQCNMCKTHIESNMIFEKGIKNVVLNIDTKELMLAYKTKRTNPSEIRKAISLIGYDADDVEADTQAHDKLPACCQKGGSHLH